MLSLFPSLFDWNFFAPTILRACAGSFLLLLAYRHLHGERAVAIESLLSRLGTLATLSVWYMGLAELLSGLSLLAGFLTQAGAILAIIIALQMLFVRIHAPRHFTYHTFVYIFLIAISLSLLVTGPGAFAFDLPL